MPSVASFSSEGGRRSAGRRCSSSGVRSDASRGRSRSQEGRWERTPNDREANQRVLERLFDRLNAGDLDGALELVADDVVWEMPFSPPALPAPFDRQRFAKVLRTWPTVFSEGLTFDEVTFSPMLDSDRVVVEFRGDARIAATGKRYRNRYVGLFYGGGAPVGSAAFPSSVDVSAAFAGLTRSRGRVSTGVARRIVRLR